MGRRARSAQRKAPSSSEVGPAATSPSGQQAGEAGRLGHKRGGRRVLSPFLAGSLRSALKEERARSRQSYGAILIEAFSHHWSEVRSAHLPEQEVDPTFGLPARTRRVVEDGAEMLVYVTEEQAEAIARAATELRASVSETCSWVLELELAARSAAAQSETARGDHEVWK